jgi:hypothetical protein
MNEAEWQVSEDATAMLSYLLANRDIGKGRLGRQDVATDRKLRLFVEAHRCEQCERVWGDDTWVWRAEYLAGASCGARKQKADLLRDLFGNPFRPLRRFGRAVCDHTMRELFVLTPTVLSLAQAAYDEREKKCDHCEGFGWTLTRLAEGKRRCVDCNGTGQILDGSLDNDRLGVLADALEEAGCPAEVEEKCQRCDDGVVRHERDSSSDHECFDCDETGKVKVSNPLLIHLRSPGPHVRGCWALDLILGKE